MASGISVLGQVPGRMRQKISGVLQELQAQAEAGEKLLLGKSIVTKSLKSKGQEEAISWSDEATLG